jgi:carbamoyltransferase
MPYYLGIACLGHEAAASIAYNGKLIAAAEEERFNRIKHTSEFPHNAIKYCLDACNITIDDLESISIHVNRSKFIYGRLYELIRYMPRSLMMFKKGATMMPATNRFKILTNLQNVIGQNQRFKKFPKVHGVEHHIAHAASAFYVSDFDDSAIVTIDGIGETATGIIAEGNGTKINKIEEIDFPQSLGFFYAAMTQYLGFRANSDEYKVMGLSAYGEPEFYDEFRKIICPKDKGRYKIDLSYFRYHYSGNSGQMFSKKMEKKFGPARRHNEEVTIRHKNIAASIQTLLEDLGLDIVNRASSLSKSKNLCMAGGVALNCLMNRRILKESSFDNLFIQPASNDAGNSLGSALYTAISSSGNPRETVMKHAYWGPEFSEDKIENVLKQNNLKYEKVTDIAKQTARHISEGKIVGWFQGRMEFGPRALGNRSIVIDPRRKEMKDILNLRVKKREEFRPFAPSVLVEYSDQYFDLNVPSPYMLLIAKVHPEKRKDIPAVTHVDGTARIQTVDRTTNPLYWNLINEFYKITGVPVILNTSFNENEPIVCTPEEAVNCFLKTQFDVLAMGNFVTIKS